MIVDFNRSFIEWETNEHSKGRFLIDSVLKTKTDLFYLGAKVLACNVYNSTDFFKMPSYSFQVQVSNSQYSIYRVILGDLKADNSINKSINDFNSFHKEINYVYEYKIIKSFTSLLKEYNNKRQLQVLLKYDEIELEFPVKHININEHTNKFQIETGEVLIIDDNIIKKAYVAFSSFNYAEFITEFEVDLRNYFNQRKSINAEINILAH